MLELLHTAYRRHVLVNNLGAGARVFLYDILAEVVLLVQPQRPLQRRWWSVPQVRKPSSSLQDDSWQECKPVLWPVSPGWKAAR
jgi:hypothetical protein